MPDKRKRPTAEELLAHVRKTYLVAGLDEEVLQEFSRDLDWVALREGENLFRQGDPSDSAFVVIDGILEVAIVQPDGSERFVGQVEPGQLVGEMGVFTGATRGASVYAHSKCAAQLVKIPESAFARVAKTNPVALAQVGETIRQRLHRNQLAAMLPNLFGPLDEDTFDRIEAEGEWVQLPRGEVLMQQGDPGDSMYILIRGRLQARITDQEGNKIVVGEITPGESVGEMAMFTSEPRTADVLAVRDSALIKFTKAGFDRLLERYPQVVRQITNIVIGRLRRLTYNRTLPQNVCNITLIPLNPGVPTSLFAERLVTALGKLDVVTHLSSRRVDERLALEGISQAESDNPLYLRLTAWLDEQETTSRFVVFEADPEMTAWTRRAIRQADRILFVGHAGDDPAITPFLAQVDKVATVRRDLVLLYPDGHAAPEDTRRWLDQRPVTKHYHLRWNRDGDFERLARFLAGKAIGLCLGGGGARGFAHFGVIRTLLEAGVPIDIIGGNSMGAYVSAVYAVGTARGWSVRQMIDATRKIFSRWHYHVTLPITSIFADGILVHDIKDCLGDARIEDLWIPFFCVSSNLTRAEVKTHTTGELWRAVRVSGGLPAVVPPVVFDGDLHVDGALLNNLPIDVMSELCDGGEVIAIDVSPIVDMGENTSYGDSLSGFDIVISKVNPLAEPIRIPTLPTIMQRSAEIGAVLQLKGIVDKLTDLYISMPVEQFDILGFKDAEQIVQRGYEEAQKRILPWLEERERARRLA